jgi:hypothetical protein
MRRTRGGGNGRPNLGKAAKWKSIAIDESEDEQQEQQEANDSTTDESSDPTAETDETPEKKKPPHKRVIVEVEMLVEAFKNS